MQIKYAVSTMIFWWRENYLSLEQECQFLKSRGFGVELWPSMKGYNECRYSKRYWSRLTEATKDMLVVMRSRNDNPSLEQWREQIDCARLLDADIVTDLHSFGIAENSDIRDCDFSAEIIDYANQNQVSISIETGPLKRVLELVEKFDDLRICLDVGYANIDPKFTFKDYASQLAEKVRHLHLTDNYGQADDHQPPGLKGGISRENWDYLLSCLEKSGNDIIASIEMTPSMPDVMLRQACEFIFDELSWPGKPQSEPSYCCVYNPV
ncbi:MAG TPA: sugar phosphate isomerase/epimerase [Sedimentisphaerales bacterium]|nr:sugar phosphate isomerase/epimerase [Sedimentisphaerales bacterium]